MNRILIVDDDPGVVAAVAALLEAYDLSAEGVWDPDQAEELLASEFFPVVLADLRFRTEEDGYRLLESIRRISPRTRVASMTGHLTDEIEARVRELGARLVLRKPVDDGVLVRVLREMLEEVEQAAGDDDFETVYHNTAGVLQAIARGRFRFDADDAEELIQEAWCLFLEKRQSVRKPKAWLTGTVANLCRQEIERRARDRERSDEFPDDLAVDSCDDAVLAVHQALAKLDDRSRTLCEQIGIEQRSYDEVSAGTGLPLGSVGPLYLRAKEKLRRALVN
ncbi:MAG TPA: response regulator [Thermoanaerobaculia bacterium]|jgi:RNA polymerase sigma factor (sigma-70 family)